MGPHGPALHKEASTSTSLSCAVRRPPPRLPGLVNSIVWYTVAAARSPPPQVTPSPPLLRLLPFPLLPLLPSVPCCCCPSAQRLQHGALLELHPFRRQNVTRLIRFEMLLKFAGRRRRLDECAGTSRPQPPQGGAARRLENEVHPARCKGCKWVAGLLAKLTLSARNNVGR